MNHPQMLFGGLEHLDYFYLFFHSIYGNVIIPIDFRIFFRGVGLNHQPVAVSYFQKSPCGIGARVLIPPKNGDGEAVVLGDF
jgi:hypothetical protein